MFKWLFKKKEAPERIVRAVHLPELVTKLAKDALKETEDKIEQLREDAARSKDHIHTDLQILEYAGLHNDRIPERAKAIMQGNREHYCRRVRQAMDLIHFPHDVMQLQEALNDGLSQIDSLGKDVQKNMLVLKEFFSHETGAVNRELDMLQHNILEMKRTLDASPFKILEQIKVELEIYGKNRKECEETNKQILLLKSDDSELEKKQAKTEERMASIRASADYRTGQDLAEQKRLMDEKQENELRPFNEAISTLQLALKKYAYSGKGDDLLKQYEDEPVDALLRDTDLKLLETLNKIEAEIKDGTLPLKDKKRQKSIEAADMLKQNLRQFQLIIMEHDDKMHQLNKRLMQNVALMSLAEQERFLDAVKNERDAVNMRITEHQQELGIKDPTLALRSLEQLLTNLGEMSIKIVE